jgi:hypothetical protein
MKRFTPILLFLLLAGICQAQNSVVDTHPNATIYMLDYQSGQDVLATSDMAILFKDAFIDLVNNTNTARFQRGRPVPGKKSITISQADPAQNGNAYQLTLQSQYFQQTITVYTFLYNVDQNTLYYYNPSTQSWAPELVQGPNVNNLNNCLAYGKFNEQQPAGGNVTAQQGPDTDQDTQPVDTAATVDTAPPPLPEYTQPECPADGYLWQPGYWAYSRAAFGYYWVPGVWVAPPNPGLLWTPAYWGYVGSVYVFHAGYWGVSVGFYGGINYGYGYQGRGFVGGEWRDGGFRYNTAVVRVNTTVVHNTYVNTTVINNTVVNNRSSFNGRGGVVAAPTASETAAMHQQHIPATSEQIRNQQASRADKSQFASANGGRPTNLAAAKAPATVPHTNVNSTVRGGSNPGFNQNRSNAAQSPSLNSRPGTTPAPSANGRTPGINVTPSPGTNTNVRATGNAGAPSQSANTNHRMPGPPRTGLNTGNRNTPQAQSKRPNNNQHGQKQKN